MKLVAGDVIDIDTFKSLRKALLNAFGLSASKTMQQIRIVIFDKDVLFDLVAGAFRNSIPALPDRAV